VKPIIERKKLLTIIVVVVLAIATGILGYHAYSQYRMSQMDKYMIQANKTYDEANRLVDGANSYAYEERPTDTIF